MTQARKARALRERSFGGEQQRKELKTALGHPIAACLIFCLACTYIECLLQISVR